MENYSAFNASTRLHYVSLAALVCLGIFTAPSASAKASTLCPTLKASVVNAGSVVVDVSACDGPFDGGMSGPIRPFAQHGVVTIGKNNRNLQRVTYKHKGNSASTDVFYLEDNDNGVVTVNISIAKAKSRKS